MISVDASWTQMTRPSAAIMRYSCSNRAPLTGPSVARTRISVLGVDDGEAEVPVGGEALRRVAEQVLHLRADVGHADPLVVEDVAVGDGGDVLDELMRSCLGFERLAVEPLPLDRSAEDGGRGPEGGKLVVAPVTGVDAIVEPDGSPPLAPDEDRDLRQRDDPMRFQRRSFRRREVRHRAPDDLATSQDARPPAEPRLRPRRRAEVEVVHHTDDRVLRPFGQPRGREAAVIIVEVRRDVRPGDARGLSQALEHLVGDVLPSRGQEQPFGGEGDGVDDAMAAQRLEGSGTCRAHVAAAPSSDGGYVPVGVAS